MTFSKGTKPPAVLITGASTGIGAAAAHLLHRRGFRVFAGVRRAEDGAALCAVSPGVAPLMLDVTLPEHREKALETIAASLDGSPMAGLINNAGIAVAGPLECIPLDEIRRQFEVNLFSVIALSQLFLPLLRTHHGRIINVGSIGGRIAFPFVGPYAATKFAMEAVCDAMRLELSAWKIPVSLIEAGAIDTPMWKKSRDHGDHLALGMSPEQHTLYDGLLEKIRKHTAHVAQTASPAEPVAAVIHRALTASNPKARYRVGKYATLHYLFGCYFPDRLRDFSLRQFLGRP